MEICLGDDGACVMCVHWLPSVGSSYFGGWMGSGRVVVWDRDMFGWRWSLCNVFSLVTVCWLLVFVGVDG